MGISTTSLTSGSGSEDVSMGLLKLLADPSTLKSRISDFEAAEARANAAIALAGKASEIPKLLKEATEKYASADVTLAEAREKAKKVTADAEVQRDANLKLSADTKAQADAALAEAKATLDEARKTAAAQKRDAKKILDDAAAEKAGFASERAGLIASLNQARLDADAEKKEAEDLSIRLQAKLKKLGGDV